MRKKFTIILGVGLMPLRAYFISTTEDEKKNINIMF